MSINISFPITTRLKAINHKDFISEKWSDVRTKQIWLRAAAFICLTGAILSGAVAFATTLTYLAATAALVVGAVSLVWYSFQLIDYENTSVLAKIRARAQDKPLTATVQEHGWKNLFRYAIISPDRFQELYQAHVNTLNFSEIILFYENANQQLFEAKAFPRSHASFFKPILEPKIWKSKLKEETREWQFSRFSPQLLIDAIRYDALSLSELASSLETHFEHVSLSQVIDAYESASRCIREAGRLHYLSVIPEPGQWREKFRRETCHLNASSILKDYPISRQKLYRYLIISQEEFSLLGQGQEIYDRFELRCSQLEADFSQRTEPNRNVRDHIKHLANQTYDTNPAHTLLINLHSQHTEAIKQAEKIARDQITAENSLVSNYEKLFLNRSITEEEQAYLNFLKSTCNQNCIKIEYHLKRQKSELETSYSQMRFSLEQTLAAARKLCEETKLLADKNYQLETSQFRAETDAKIAEYRKRRDKDIEHFNARYNYFRDNLRIPTIEG